MFVLKDDVLPDFTERLLVDLDIPSDTKRVLPELPAKLHQSVPRFFTVFTFFSPCFFFRDFFMVISWIFRGLSES